VIGSNSGENDTLTHEQIDLQNTSRPFYEQIKEALRERIASGFFKAGAAIPKECDLAKELGVSRKTTRRAILELAEQGLLERIRGKGTYVRSSFAPQATGRKKTIGIATTQDPLGSISIYYSRILQGVFKGAADAGMLLSWQQISTPYEEFVAALRRNAALKGLLLMGASKPELLQTLDRLSIPVVLLESARAADTPVIDQVIHNDEPGIYSAVSYLIHLGHKDIGLLRSEGTTEITKARIEGYDRALRENGLPLRPELAYPVPFCSEAAYAATCRLIHDKVVPTALVTTGDELAVGALSALSDNGWSVPRDMSLTGFGDLGLFTSPRLSTIRVPWQQLGLTAIQVLKNRLENPTGPFQKIVLPVEWIPRNSCDRPRDKMPGKERID
jgi:DNA-binding LacI/PurR family transcriptional regulator